MDLLQRLGGRKFLMACLILGLGSYIEFVRPGGLTQNLVMLFVGVLGAFSAANHMTSSVYMKTRRGDSGSAGPVLDQEIVSKINAVHAAAIQAQDPNNPNTQELKNLLVSINTGVRGVQETTSQVGLSVLNMNKEVMKVKNAVAQPDFR